MRSKSKSLTKDLGSSNLGLRAREIWESKKRSRQSPFSVLTRCCVRLPKAIAGNLSYAHLPALLTSTLISTHFPSSSRFLWFYLICCHYPTSSGLICSSPREPQSPTNCSLPGVSVSLSVFLNHNWDHTVSLLYNLNGSWLPLGMSISSFGLHNLVPTYFSRFHHYSYDEWLVFFATLEHAIL